MPQQHAHGQLTSLFPSHTCPASLQTLLTNLESLMAWTSQTSIGGVPLAGEDTSQQTTTISDEISLLSDQGSTLYNQLRGVRDASGVVASVLSGGRAR